MELDTTKLKQAGFRKTVSHDNCNVLDIGSGSFPRYIEVRPPGDDGSRMTAIWDGILNLAVNDKVICIEYASNPIWRVNSIGGGGSGVGTIRVNKVFASDFSSESLVTDATDNVTINTGTLTLPSDIIHAGDTDTKISFIDDDIEFTVGALSMLKLTETTQDLITLGPGSGDVDIDFNGDMFLRGSDGRLGLGESAPDRFFHMKDANVAMKLEDTSSGEFWLFGETIVNNEFSIRHNLENPPTLHMNNANRQIAINSTAFNGQFLIDQSSTIGARVVLSLDQGDVDEPFVRYVGTAAAATLTRSIVAIGDVTTATSRGFIKIEVLDIGNQVTDQDYFVEFFTLA